MLGLDNPLHIAIVLIVVLLVFGAKRLPEMGKSLGEGLRGFKASVSGDSDDHHGILAELHAHDTDTAAPSAAERAPARVA
jgi:sec-independent protein translocase protein TatA